MRYSIIIPAYNEAKRISGTLESIAQYIRERKLEHDAEVIVVNNRSKDATVQVVQQLQTHMPFVRIVDELRPGKGYAVTRGMLVARGDLRLFTDADNATTIDHLDRFVPAISKGYDVVIGSLAVPGAVVLAGGAEPLWRVILGKLGNKWIQLLAVWGISDTQRGFKLFTARAAMDIFPRLTIFGWGFDVEVLAVARSRGYRIRELPVHWRNDPDSKVNIWAYPQVLMQTVRVFLNRLTGRYRR